MKTPAMTPDGYPTEGTLDIIRRWEIVTAQDAIDAMEYVGQAWSYPTHWTVERGWNDDLGHPKARYVFSTGGWSGNEELVEAIEANVMLQTLGAWSWRRGGHYEYRFREPDEAAVNAAIGEPG